jgi:hypothetical protein
MSTHPHTNLYTPCILCLHSHPADHHSHPSPHHRHCYHHSLITIDHNVNDHQPIISIFSTPPPRDASRATHALECTGMHWNALDIILHSHQQGIHGNHALEYIHPCNHPTMHTTEHTPFTHHHPSPRMATICITWHPHPPPNDPTTQHTSLITRITKCQPLQIPPPPLAIHTTHPITPINTTTITQLS